MLLTVGAKATITAEANQMWWGYFVGNEERQGLGTKSDGMFTQCIYVPANHELVGNSTIKAVRIYFCSIPVLNDVKIFISKLQPKNLSEAEYVQDVPTSMLIGGIEDGSRDGLPNDIELTTPYVVDNKGFYIGYTYTIKGGTTADDLYQCVTGGNWVSNSMYLKIGDNDWQTLSQYGKLAIQLLIEGGQYPNYFATPSDFGEEAVQIGSSVNIPINIVNKGKDPITSITYTITSDGTTSTPQTIAVSPAIPYGASADVQIPFVADSQLGTVAKTLTITEVNGQPNTAPDKSATGMLRTVEELKLFPRTVLIEEFTTENCVYCPQAAAALSATLTNNPDLASQVAVICHHVGFYDDWLTIQNDRALEWLYGTGGRYSGTFAPAFMWDRSAKTGQSPVQDSPSSENGFKYQINNRLEVKSNAKIDMTAYYNDEKNKITVIASCERGKVFSSTPARMTVVLTEDNVKARAQSGANGTFIHQHVARASNGSWGEELTWNNDETKYTCEFSIDPAWKIDDLKVVAFVGGYDQNDQSKCAIENAAVVVPGDSSTDIDTALNDDRNDNDAVYDLQGRQIVNSKSAKSKLSKGLYIFGGKKVLVK